MTVMRFLDKNQYELQYSGGNLANPLAFLKRDQTPAVVITYRVPLRTEM